MVSLAARTSESGRPEGTLPEEGSHIAMNAAHKLAELHLPADRHPEDIKAAVRKSGWAFTQLGLRFGYGRKSVDRALYRPWPAVERLISAVVGEAPWVLWPSRYRSLSEADKTSILAGIERLRLRLAQEPSRIRPI